MTIMNLLLNMINNQIDLEKFIMYCYCPKL